MPTKRLIFALLLCAVPALSQERSGLADARGFGTDRSFGGGDFDRINLYNGNMTLVLPLGSEYPITSDWAYSFVLSYNSKVWDYKTRNAGNNTQYVYTRPAERSNTGLGWMLSLGRLDIPCDTGRICDFAFTSSPGNYESPDGAEHAFYATLHDGETASAAPVVGYTRDGTFLRLLKYPTPGEWHVEFSDGTVHVFEEYELGTNKTRLKNIHDLRGNTLSVTYDATSWSITDPHGRVQKVYWRTFDNPKYANYGQGVDRVELTASNLRTVTYKFDYNYRARTDTDPGAFYTRRGDTYRGVWDPDEDRYVTVPVLTSVTAKDAATNEVLQIFTFDYYQNLSPPSLVAVMTGELRTMTLPTGGTTTWEYDTYLHPDSSCDVAQADYLFGVGVRKRTRNALDGLGDLVTTYTPANIQQTAVINWPCLGMQPQGIAPPEVFTNTVISPLGHRTINYFADWNKPFASPGGTSKRELGLPFDKTYPVGTPSRFRSTEEYECASAAPDLATAQCQLKRSAYLRYETDPSTEHWVANRRVAADRLIYHESACAPASSCRYTDRARTIYDGLGHYRQESFTANFQNGADTRTTFTNWNPSAGTFTGDTSNTFVVPPANQWWVYNKYSLQNVFDGSSYAHQLATFDAYGKLSSMRKTTSRPTSITGQPSFSAQDLLVGYCRDASGNVASERYFGGDRGNAPGDPCTSSVGSGLGEYQINYTYSGGRTATAAYAGMVPPIYHVNNTIDVRSGLVTVTADTAGTTTTFEYDVLGRLTWNKPTGQAWTKSEYTQSATNTPATAIVTTYPSGATAGTSLTQARSEYDGLGRLWRESRVMPGGTWSVRQHHYNANGWLDWVSSSQSSGTQPPTSSFTPLYKTIYESFDAFGRPRTIKAPDYSPTNQSVTTITYDGPYQLERTIRLNAAQILSTTRETYDARGRVAQVQEPGTDGALTTPNSTTSYTYDVLGNLATVNIAGTTTQTRTFTYDNRGFLNFEDHPEKDVTTYRDYDARGNVGRSTTGPDQGAFDVKYDYDHAGRVTRVNHYFDNQWQPIKELFYASENQGLDKQKGKLVRARRHNVHPLQLYYIVDETYRYEDTGGRMSHRITDLAERIYFSGGFEDDPLQQWQQWFTYDDLGNVTSPGYPACLYGCSTGESKIQAVTNSYTNGFLTQVAPSPGSSSTISYHPNGMIHQVTHSNGVIDTYGLDPYGMSRPASVGFRNFMNPPACPAPVISTPPGNQTVNSGQSATLWVTATGSGTLSYQWYRGSSGDTSTPVGGNSSSYQTPALVVTSTYWVRVTNTCINGTAFSNSSTATVTVASLPAPVGFSATFDGTSSVQLSWGSVSGATSYEIFRYSSLSAPSTTPIATSITTSWVDSVGLSATYLYRVRAVAGSSTSDFSSVDYASAFSFTDPVLIAGVTAVRALHVDQLRRSIDSLRISANLDAVWAGYVSVAGQTIQAADLSQMREALAAARDRFAYSSLFTDVPLQIHVTPLRALHITELRNYTK